MYASDAYRSYLPVVLSAFAVLILGFWNPRFIHAHGSSVGEKGRSGYLWLSLAALLVGVLTVWLIKV